jgi:C4-type Zn-finger protein
MDFNMKHECPMCENVMTPRKDEYPGELGLMVTIQVCKICNFEYLPHKEEYRLDKELLFRRTAEVEQLKAKLAKVEEALRKLGEK